MNKKYNFYGWQNADVSAVSDDYPGISTPYELYDTLLNIWCEYTCAPRLREEWSPENITLGQCSITAFLVQDIFGGKVYGVLRPGGNYHCYNDVDGHIFDLTSEQFGDEILSYVDNPEQFREVHFQKEEKKQRYEYLCEKLKEYCCEENKEVSVANVPQKIVVLEADAAGVSFDALSKYGELVTYDHTPQELVAERIKDATIVVPNKCIIDESVLKNAKNVKLIAEAATGYNNIDVEYCHKRGITVTNARGYSTEAVVQHTFALLLSLWEHLKYYENYVNSGEYCKSESFTHMGRVFHELTGKRFGIIGLGAIGRRVAEVATAFGMEVVYYSASGGSYDVPYKRLDLDIFLKTCDIISCHAPLNERTNRLMDYSAFKKCKPEAVFLNLGRGPIVVEADLVRALEDGKIAGAALDVYEKEPLPADSPLMSYLERHSGDEYAEKLLLTPHVAWAPLEARERLVEDVAASIESWMKGEARSVVTEKK